MKFHLPSFAAARILLLFIAPRWSALVIAVFGGWLISLNVTMMAPLVVAESEKNGRRRSTHNEDEEEEAVAGRRRANKGRLVGPLVLAGRGQTGEEESTISKLRRHESFPCGTRKYSTRKGHLDKVHANVGMSRATGDVELAELVRREVLEEGVRGSGSVAAWRRKGGWVEKSALKGMTFPSVTQCHFS